MGAFQIVVQTISGFPMEVDVYATDTIATLKASIFYTTLVPSQSQILVYCCTVCGVVSCGVVSLRQLRGVSVKKNEKMIAD